MLISDKRGITRSYMKALDSAIPTVNDLLRHVGDSMGMSREELLDNFILEEYSPVISSDKYFLYNNNTTISFTQNFVLRLKTEEEKNLERSIRAEEMAGIKRLPSSPLRPS